MGCTNSIKCAPQVVWWVKPVGVCPGVIMHRRLSFFTMFAIVYFQLAIISTLELVKNP